MLPAEGLPQNWQRENSNAKSAVKAHAFIKQLSDATWAVSRSIVFVIVDSVELSSHYVSYIYIPFIYMYIPFIYTILMFSVQQ